MQHVPSTRNALVTGAAVRVGREIALRLAHEGWNVAVHFRSSKTQAQSLAQDIEKLGRKAALVQGDLSEPEAPQRIMEQAAQALGPITCLINNASVFEKDNLETLSEKMLATHFAVNAFAPLWLLRAFAAQCPKDAGGCIVNIGDGTPGWSMSPNFLSYTLSKLTLMDLAPLLARELAPHIRINTIAPGPTLPSKQNEEATFMKLKKTFPLQRSADTQEVCDAVSYLLGAPSVTGQCLYLSGGAHLFVPNT